MKKLYITLLSVLLVFTLCFGILFFTSQSIIKELPYKSLCESWQGESQYKYSFLSAYFNDSSKKTYEDYLYIDRDIKAKLTENSITLPEDASADAQLYMSSYCAEKQVNVFNDLKTGGIAAQGVFVGGDFFAFHPEELLYGSFFSADSINMQSVVVDKNLAFRLFGSTDVCGLEVMVNDRYYTVCGVVSLPEDKYVSLTYSEKPRIWLPYNYLDEESTGTYISCIEYLMPERLDGMALDIFTRCVGVSDNTGMVSENSKRLGLESLYKNLKKINTWAIPENRVIPMYWENSLRIAVAKCSVLLFFEIICVIIVLISFVILGVVLWFRRKWRLKDIKNFICNKCESFAETIREKQKERKKRMLQKKMRKGFEKELASAFKQLRKTEKHSERDNNGGNDDNHENDN